MDGANCRTPMGCGINREGAYVQTWESNRAIRMENIGETDVINPWLSNGRNTFRSAHEIVAAVTAPGMTDAEKAYALWFQEIQYRHHSGGDNNELLDPVKVFNVYGYNTCGNDSIALGTLWHTAGLKVAPARALGHCISQAFHDGGWHFYDGDMHSVYLMRDNETVASEQDIVRDHDLVKRTHSKGIMMQDTWWDGQGMCAMYFYQGEVTGERGGKSATTMNMVLRPGEALVWRWGQVSPLKYHGALQTVPTYESTIYNGLWEYKPNLANSLWQKGAATIENVVSDAEGVKAEAGRTGTIIWNMRSPYVFVGGKIDAEGNGARFSISFDGKNWQSVTNNLDKAFPIVGTARYEYQLRCQLEGTSKLHAISIVNDLQMAPRALPEMTVGENLFSYGDDAKSDRKIRITHEWVERSASRPPMAPSTAVYPPMNGDAEGTDIVFKWSPAQDADGDDIADYQFELSNRPDMRWPLSMSFYKLISRTADGAKEKGKTKGSIKSQYTLPEAGLLTPDRNYYWHVRAMDDKGVWGPWSQTWSFTAHSAPQPVDVALTYDRATGTGVLKWKQNPIGRRPVKYRVYGSNEKGFTIADKAFQGTVGITKEEMATWNPWFPANFIGETVTTEMTVQGESVNLAGGNKSYYRVVAIDAKGNRSGPSDYAAAPRPIIYSKPVRLAKVGEEYRYPILVNHSLGDLSSRMKPDGQQVSGYFDIEHPQFVIERGPSWLKIDPSSGVLGGKPDAAGKSEVVVTARIERQVRTLDEPTLKWGNEKVISVASEEVGNSTQRFTIEVQ